MSTSKGILITSSVMRVAIDLPISWYCGAFPAGPNNRNKNLKEKWKYIDLSINNIHT